MTDHRIRWAATVPVAFAIAVALLATATAAAPGGGCFEPNAIGFPLPNMTSPFGMCPAGWYCPNSDPANSSTWPVVCPPSSSCAADRLNYIVCGPQGLYEPQPCLEGWYCPSSRQRNRCPSGSYCPAGSTQPKTCNGLSYCPEGTHTDYFVGIVLVIVIVDAAVCALYLGSRWYFAQPSAMTEAPAGETADVTTARLIREALGDAKPVQISFQNLSVQLSAKHETAPGKMLLQGVSGSLRAGEVTAIMGPSGAGKTVLFQTVLGKTPGDWELEGVLRVCGSNRSLQDFPHLVGFVPQDDVLRGEMTVSECLRYSSEIRLPSDWSASKRHELRCAVLRALGIDHVRDVTIGDDETRGVSGGQRKRCSVAVELASAPAAIFLDEPTTGLDATAALELVRLLKVIARQARIPVAMVIHQPRVEIWNELDSLLLLAPGGRTVYSGPCAGATDFLKGVVDMPQLHEGKGNPADHAMDVVALMGQQLADHWQHVCEATTPLLAESEPPSRDTASFMKQLAMAHVRSVVASLRKSNLFLLDVLLGIIGGTLLTAAAVNESYKSTFSGPLFLLSPATSPQNASMLFMLWGIALAAALGPAGVRAFGSVRTVYWREAAAGHSKLAYYVGASTAEAYRLILTMLHFTAVVYLMWVPNMSFGTLFGLLLLYGLAIDSQSITLGNILPPALAPLLSTVIGVFTALFNGFPTIPGSFAFYSFAITELGYSYETHPVDTFYTADSIKKRLKYTLDNYDVDFVTIFGWIIGCRVLGYIVMVLLNRDKQR